MKSINAEMIMDWERSESCPELISPVLKYYDEKKGKWIKHYVGGKKERMKSDKRVGKIINDIKKYGLKDDKPTMRQSFLSFLFCRGNK